MSVEFADHQEKFGKIFESFEFWPKIHDGDTIIDLGCGGGSLTRKLALKSSSANFLGIDVNSGTLEVATQRANDLNLTNTRFLAGNACDNQGFKIDKANGIFCRFLMEDLPDPSQALKNMYEVLKPGGWICATERLNSFYKVYPESDAIERSWGAIYKYFEKEYSAYPDITKRLPELFEKTGFREIQVQGYSSVLSKKNSGDIYDWYINMAQKIIESTKETLVKADFVNESTLKQAIADYKILLDSPNTFILETAICISGVK